MSAILSSTTGPQVPLTSPVHLLLADEDPAGGPHSTLFRRSQGPRAELYRLRPGVYTPRKEWESLPNAKRHLVRILANAHAPRGRRTGVLARESAAVVLGIPMIGPLPNRLQFVLPGGRHGDNTPLAHVSTAPEDTPIVVAHGLPVTDPAHTAVDLMRHRSFQSGLVTLDHVLRERLATPEELLDIVETQPGRQGNSRARLCLKHGDARSESVGESLSRAVVIEQHLPIPDLQVSYYDRDGRFVARVDFAWPELRRVGEFDGAGKYRREVSGVASERALLDERQRENRIEVVTGLKVIRWTWDDLMRPERFLRILANGGIVPLR
ncbi:hypothetical protein [Actinomyces sp. zg296]|uniref:hypothetical protein n=1 Tax=Actinomyces sp. zg296 TaxID=2609289 RepID=UPI001359112D|nr:hypothetical protein [Actinomyces sp. zg296]